MRRAAAALTVVALVGLAGCSSSGPGPLAATGTPSGASTGTSVPGASSTEVSFDADGTTTYATLEVPAHRQGQRLAAALLIPGSGTTDRDGNDRSLGLTAATLRLVADRLALHGVMSLRYDKYFTGRTGGGRYASTPGSITITQFFRQADAAYAYLAARPEADPAKLLVVGHSEGGMIALAVATSARVKPAGLALLEPQDERLLDLIRIQTDGAIAALVRQGALTAAEGRANAALVAQAVAQFRAGTTVSTDGMADPVVALVKPLLANPDNATYVRSDDLVVPASLAAGVRSGTRVLLTEGTRDTNVPPRTAGALVRALSAAGTTGPGLTLLRGADHLLHLAGQPDTDAVLAPDAVTALDAWVAPFAAS